MHSTAGGSITDVRGIEAGHFTDPRRPTGCSVVLARDGAIAGVDVRGAAPGTRETDLLAPTNLVESIHGVLLTGGSAWGLDAATGVVRWLEEQGVGLPLANVRLPLVPAAVLYDLGVGDARIRPDAQAGYAACDTASTGALAQGNVGAGAGALVGKTFGPARAMKGGIGTASVTVDGVTVGALVACNSHGDVIDPDTGRPVAGARTADGASLADSRRALLAGEAPHVFLAGTNTTIGVIATDAVLTKAQASRLATTSHDGLARSINPVHTMSDGDTLFMLGTGAAARTLPMVVLATMAAEVVARAVLNGILTAESVTVDGWHIPAARDLR